MRVNYLRNIKRADSPGYWYWADAYTEPIEGEVSRNIAENNTLTTTCRNAAARTGSHSTVSELAWESTHRDPRAGLAAADMYTMHGKVLSGMEAGGKLPSQL